MHKQRDRVRRKLKELVKLMPAHMSLVAVTAQIAIKCSTLI